MSNFSLFKFRLTANNINAMLQLFIEFYIKP